MKLKKEISFWSLVIGGVSAAIPFIKIIQNYWKISLNDKLQEFLDDYNRYVEELAKILFYWTDIEFSTFYLDAFIFSSVIALIFSRSGYFALTKSNEYRWLLGAGNLFLATTLILTLTVLVIPIILYPCSFLFILLYFQRRTNDAKNPTTIFCRNIFISFSASIIAIILFFYTNYLLK